MDRRAHDRRPMRSSSPQAIIAWGDEVQSARDMVDMAQLTVDMFSTTNRSLVIVDLRRTPRILASTQPVGSRAPIFVGPDSVLERLQLSGSHQHTGVLSPTDDPAIARLLDNRHCCVLPVRDAGQLVAALITGTTHRWVRRREHQMLDLVANQLGGALAAAWHRDELAATRTTDTLTGLPTTEHFEPSLRRELARSRRAKGPVSVAVVDIDGLDQLCRDHGRDRGDAVIVELSARIQRVVRTSDLVTRGAGGEFTLLLPDAAQRDAEIVAGRIQDAVKLSMADDATVSIGLATCFDGATDATSLLAEAHISVARAKSGGGNHVACREVTVR